MEASPGKFYESQIPVTGAEDFSYFSQEIPGLYFWLGINKPGEGLSQQILEREPMLLVIIPHTFMLMIQH